MMPGFGGGYGYEDHAQANQTATVPPQLKLKYETPMKNANRVKAVAFHPEMSWVIVALHSGLVQIWDYEYAVLYDEYHAHTGPCRAVDFHPNQPIFCTGGDDHLVKVFNYKKKQLLFELAGHLDYVRSVQFHHEYPWIVSASDDHMITIWNWQSRQSVAVLTGHNHYVMCARFHPSEDLLVSASLDATVRVWDISNLRERTRSNHGQRPRNQFAMPTDYKVQFVMTGHSKGVNWANFHPTMPYIVSGGDDRQVLIYQYSSMNWSLKSTYKSHFSNVGMVCFHPTSGYVFSASEDNTVRVFPGIDGDSYSNEPLVVHRKDNSRFWAVSCHPTKNLIALGHDSGTQVIKLNRERVPAAVSGDPNDSRIFTIRNNWITVQDFDEISIQQSLTKVPAYLIPSQTDNPNHSALRRGLDQEFTLRTLRANVLNPSSNAFIVTYQKESDDTAGPVLIAGTVPGSTSSTGPQHNKMAYGAAFVARNRLALLESPNAISIYDTNMALSKRIDLDQDYNRLFFAGSNRVLLKQELSLSLYEISSRKVLGSIPISPQSKIQQIIFDHNLSLFAVLCHINVGYRSTIILAQILDSSIPSNTDGATESTLRLLYTHHDSMRIKSGAFTEQGAFIYSTYKHSKYLLPWGDQGVTQSWNDVIYIHRASKGQVSYIDRAQGCIKKAPLDCTELNFKLALHYGKLDRVAHYVKNGNLCGSAILGHLKRVGYPEVALTFIEDPLTRFNLSLSYGNITEAKKCAEALDKPLLWSRLADAAILHGKYHEAEAAYQRQKDLGRLIHLYMLTGNYKSLKRLMKPLAKMRDSSNLFFLCLLTGAAKERSKVLEDLGMKSLASTVQPADTLLSSLLDDERQSMEPWNIKFVPNPAGDSSAYLASGPAEMVDFEVALERTEVRAIPAGVPAFRGASGHALMDDFGDFEADEFEDLLDDLDMDDVQMMRGARGSASGAMVQDQQVSTDQLFLGKSPEQRWIENNPMNALVAAQAGEYSTALDVMRKTVGVKNTEPFRSLFESVVFSSNYSGLPGGRTIPVYSDGGDEPPQAPPTCQIDEVEQLTASLEQGFCQNMHEAVISNGRKVLALCALLQSSSPASTDAETIESSKQTASQLVMASSLEMARKEATPAEGAALMMIEATALKLPTKADTAAIKCAISYMVKAKMFLCAAALCRKIIAPLEAQNRPLPPQVVKVLNLSEQHATDAYELPFNTSDIDLAICSKTFAAIPSGNHPANTADQVVRCPLCDSKALPQFRGDICGACDIAELGLRTISTAR